jgi:hypothetical protein
MDKEEHENHSYLGDGVYAEFNPSGTWLRTGNHQDELCDDKIYLEHHVLDSLNQFVRHRLDHE